LQVVGLSARSRVWFPQQKRDDGLPVSLPLQSAEQDRQSSPGSQIPLPQYAGGQSTPQLAKFSSPAQKPSPQQYWMTFVLPRVQVFPPLEHALFEQSVVNPQHRLPAVLQSSGQLRQVSPPPISHTPFPQTER
jgi:hypothetical protein